MMQKRLQSLSSITCSESMRGIMLYPLLATFLTDSQHKWWMGNHNGYQLETAASSYSPTNKLINNPWILWQRNCNWPDANSSSLIATLVLFCEAQYKKHGNMPGLENIWTVQPHKCSTVNLQPIYNSATYPVLAYNYHSSFYQDSN